jgi:hypothetical protein
MTERKSKTFEKETELERYRSLVLATLDCYIENDLFHPKTEDYDPQERLRSLKAKTEEHFQKGRLTRLKQWFRDLTEMQVETVDLKFNHYLRERTGYHVDIFQFYFKRINKVIEKGKITSDSQFYDINMAVDRLCQTKPVDKERLELLNGLLIAYQQRRTKKS